MTREAMNLAADKIHKEAKRQAHEEVADWPSELCHKKMWVHVYHVKKRAITKL